MITTRAQREALARVYARMKSGDNPTTMTYRQFRRTVVPNGLLDCLMVPFAGMWLGIELDGYTHS